MAQQALGANDESSALNRAEDIQGRGKGNEYMSGDFPGAVMMKVNLWGAVEKPGIHYVPLQTDLITLLSFAGGPRDSAELDEVLIKRKAKLKTQKIDVDVEELLKGVGATNPTLEPNDIILVPSTPQVVSNNTLAVIGLITSVLGIVAISISLSKQ